MRALRRWWLAIAIANARREIEMFELDLAVAAQNREVMRRRLARMEVEMIDLERSDIVCCKSSDHNGLPRTLICDKRCGRRDA